jgi:hypothetical protein
VAAAIVASSKAGGGILTQEDLARYKVRELAPIECDYRGFHVVSAPPPSSGGVVICEILNVLEGYPLRDLGFRSAQAVHYQIEAMRHAYMDRNSYLGDPDFVKNPLARLLDKNYAASIRQAIDPQKAGISAQIKPGVAPHEGSNTTHYSIVDKDGNAVSVTYTLNDWFGAQGDGARHGRDAERRDGRLHGQDRRAQPVRPGAGPGQFHRARQDAAVVDVADHRHARRQAGDGGGHAGRQPHHHRGAAHDPERDRLRHGRAGSRRRAALPPAVAATTPRPTCCCTSRPATSARKSPRPGPASTRCCPRRCASARTRARCRACRPSAGWTRTRPACCC